MHPVPQVGYMPKAVPKALGVLCFFVFFPNSFVGQSMNAVASLENKVGPMLQFCKFLKLAFVASPLRSGIIT